MTSLILQSTTRFLLPVLLLFAVFLLLRGHNSPGGGFAGGLVAASAYTLYALAYGVPAARQSLRVDPRELIGIGLLIALASGVVSVVAGKEWFTGIWGHLPMPDASELHLGTPLVFDIGVFLTVTGVALTIILTLAEEE
jgi:multicomponent Na+:H+ antiporter subunit B